MRPFLLFVLMIATSAVCSADGSPKQCPPRDNPAASLRLQLAATGVPADMMLEFTDLSALRNGVCTKTFPVVIGFDTWSGKKLIESHMVKSTGPEAQSFAKSNGQTLYTPSQAILAALEKHNGKGVRITVWAKGSDGKYIKPVLAIDSKSKT